MKVDDTANSLSYASVIVLKEDYDPEKEYTPAAFPQFAFSAVEKSVITEDNAYLTLTLAEPGYCNFYRAITALALYPTILFVISGESIVVPDISVEPVWEISDTSIADFITPDPGENGEMAIKGLQPGTVTVTYIPSLGYYLGKDYAVTYEITVTEEDTSSEGTELTSGSETTDTGSQDTKTNSQTSDRTFASLCVLVGAAFVGCAAVVVVRYRQKTSF
ncbi:MAG: hypothetical protein HFE66_08240 [Clostridiales bacterium]|nr:hypothetical protein [Clostridiales bacterium]